MGGASHVFVCRGRVGSERTVPIGYLLSSPCWIAAYDNQKNKWFLKCRTLSTVMPDFGTQKTTHGIHGVTHHLWLNDRAAHEKISVGELSVFRDSFIREAFFLVPVNS